VESVDRGYRMGDKKLKIVCYIDAALISIKIIKIILGRKLLHRFKAEKYNIFISVQKIR